MKRLRLLAANALAIGLLNVTFVVLHIALAAPALADSENCPEGKRDNCFQIINVRDEEPKLEEFAEFMGLSAEKIRSANKNIDFSKGVPADVWIHNGSGFGVD